MKNKVTFKKTLIQWVFFYWVFGLPYGIPLIANYIIQSTFNYNSYLIIFRTLVIQSLQQLFYFCQLYIPFVNRYLSAKTSITCAVVVVL